MFPALPNRLPQFLVLIGLALITYSFVLINPILSSAPKNDYRSYSELEYTKDSILVEFRKRINMLTFALDSINLLKTDSNKQTFQIRMDLLRLNSLMVEAGTLDPPIKRLTENIKRIDTLVFEKQRDKTRVIIFYLGFSLGIIVLFIGVNLAS